MPVARDREPGTARTVMLTGPAAPRGQGFNLNGIAATGDGGTLIGVPATAALFGNTLGAVNAKFTNPAAARFEVVRVRAR